MSFTDIETTGKHIAQRLGVIIFCMEKKKIQVTLKLSEGFWEASDTLTGVVSVRMFTIVKRVAKTAFAVNIDIAENKGPSCSKFFSDLDEKVDCSSSAKNTLSKSLAEIGEKTLLQKLFFVLFRLSRTYGSRETQVLKEVVQCAGG